MTLIEFLLARIDEEEASILALFDDVRPGIGCLGDPFSTTRAKLLADLAAKRRRIGSVKGDDEWDEAAGFDPVEHAGLAEMALQYRSHQDYQDVWQAPEPT